MNRFITLFLFVSFMSLLLFGCEKQPDLPLFCDHEEAPPKGDRLVGLDLLNLSESGSFDDNINLGKDLGIDYISLHVLWSDLEPEPGSYADPHDALLLLGQYAADNDLKFSLTIRPIDLTGKTVPTDLTTTRFNDTKMISRFKSLLDYVFTRLDSTVLLNVMIGNEIDGYNTSAEPASFWEDYGVFLQEMKDYLPMQMGYTGTLYGLTDNPEPFQELLSSVDILGVTYYPLESDFTVKSPEVVLQELRQFTQTFTDIDIYLQEAGYPSDKRNNSSESQQAIFYCKLLTAWDSLSHRIKAANIIRLYDLSKQEAQNSAAAYNIGNRAFCEYLRSLGIREFDNNPKHAYGVIWEGLEARGW